MITTHRTFRTWRIVYAGKTYNAAQVYNLPAHMRTHIHTQTSDRRTCIRIIINKVRRRQRTPDRRLFTPRKKQVRQHTAAVAANIVVCLRQLLCVCER